MPNPVITSLATADFAEKATGTVYTVTANADAGKTLTYTLSGADADLFNINNNGVVTFKAVPNFEAPSDIGANNVYDIEVIASDGTLTATKAVAITVTNVNEAPVITSAATATFAENATGTVYTVTATDADASTTLAYSLSGADVGLFDINNNNGVITVTFKAAPNFEAPSDRGQDNIYNIDVKVSDGTLTDTKDVAITVTNVNETAPVITSAATATFAENGTGTVYTVTTTGAEAGTTLIYSLSGDDAGLFNINSSNGVVRFKTAPNFEAPADNGKDNSYNINVTASDGTLTDAQAVVITVTNVNEAPTITSAATVNFAENGTGTVYTVTADADPGETLTYSLSGADAGLFNINNGVVTFKTAPNFELPSDSGADKVYNIDVKVSDGALTDTQAVAITVTNVNETAPIITSAAAANFAENGTGPVYTVTTTSAEAGTTLTYSLSGADKELFNIDSNGVVTFKDAPNFEVPTDNGADKVYNIDVKVSDGALTNPLTDTKAVAITVTNVNEAPVITSAATANFAENATGTVYTVTATDADAGTTLTYSLSGDDAGLFNINRSNGLVTFKTAPNFELPTDNGANNVYDINVIASDGTLNTPQAVAITVTNVNETAPVITSAATATFAENGTGTVYTVTATGAEAGTTFTYTLSGDDAGLFNINNGVVTFKDAPNFELPTDKGANNVYDIKVTASDGALTTPLTATQAVAITVTNVNETAPTITSAATANFAENGTGTVYTVTTTGADADTIIYSLSGNDANFFNINSNGLVTFKTAPNFEAPGDSGANNVYDINVIANDGALTDTQAVAITVTNVNDAPVITSAATAIFAENGTETVYTVTATDADASTTLTYSLSGLDANLFNINSNGVVTFKTAPNFEAPGDSGANNVYDINVIANDGALTDTQAVAITVTNVNDAPVITSAATANFAENGTETVYTVTATDADASTTLTYSLSGADANLFNINNGVVTFKAVPNFEAPSDIGGNNIYNINVIASDGALTNPLTATEAVAITVTNVNEAPVITSLPTANFAENATGTVYTVTATDADASTTLTYSLSGADAGLFNINNGVVTFKTVPNFEAPSDSGGDNIYNIDVKVSDGALTNSLTATKPVAITVTNVNEAAPVITSAATANFAENGTGTVYTVTATGAEAGTTFTYTLSGADAGLFDINNGVVTFKTAPNFEAPADSDANNVYDIKVIASNGALTTPLTATQDVAITVTNVNEAPTDLTLSPSTIDEGPTVSVSFSSTDPDTGDTFTYSLVSGDGDTDNDSFTIVGDQLTPNTGVFDYETKSRYSIRVKTTDQGGSSFVKELTINVNDINKPTDLSLTSNTLTENQVIGTVVGSFTSTDPDTGKTFTYSLVPGVGDTDNNSFEIDGDQLKTKKVFNYETDRKTYNINVQTTDQNGEKFVKQLTIDLGNEAPVITSAATANFVENVTGTVYTVIATDPGTATLTYSLSGADADLFNINSNGLVTFKTAPNFEAPSDSGANNVYDINVIASDLTSGTPLAVAINVTNDVTEKDERKFGERLEVKLTGYNSKLNSELGVFFVDNADGTIITTGTGGRSIAPGTAGYTDEALRRGQVIFSLLGTGNSPVGFNQINLSRVLELNSNTILRYYLVKDGSTDSVINKTTPQSNVLFNADANGFENLRVTTNRYNTFSAPGTGVQNKPQGTTGQKELLDLAGINGPVTAEFVVNRAAAYNNFVGFYKVVNENGGIDNNGDGIADVLPTAATYAQEALKARVTDIALAVNNNGTATFKSTLQGGSIYAPFIITNGGTPDYYDNTNSRIYFTFGAANSDKVNSLNTDHVRLLGNNTFGFEDLVGGGDNDFNDVIVKVNLLV